MSSSASTRRTLHTSISVLSSTWPIQASSLSQPHSINPLPYVALQQQGAGCVVEDARNGIQQLLEACNGSPLTQRDEEGEGATATYQR